MTSIDVIAIGLLALQGGFLLIMAVYLVSGLDDLFVDMLFIALVVKRWLGHEDRHYQPSVAEMTAEPEQPFALMLPAWQEASVIRQALTATITNLDYRNFRIFVGTYVNDPDTQSEVEAVVRQHANVVHIVVPHPGPTCKADCLNWIVKGIFAYQERHGIFFAGVVLYDAEDVVDPLSLKLFNCMIPRYDLVQIPVVSLPRPWWRFTGGHYMDEFAEAHCKEIHVREWFAGIVPGAGVGTGYSPRALALSALAGNGDPFATDSLTEDYEFSYRGHRLGLKEVFVQLPIDRPGPRRWRPQRDGRRIVRHDFITTREFFPDVFWAAVRQKTRWVIGITLQGWKKFGWRGSWRIRYLYFRDRKSVVTQQFLVLGYIVALGLIGLQTSAALFPERYIFAPPLANNSPLWYLFYINAVLLVNRLVQRHFWTCRVYGWSQLPLVLPRYIVANFVSYLAVTRATMRYLKHLRTGERIGWDKTAHTYPGQDVLAAYQGGLDDIRAGVTGAASGREPAALTMDRPVERRVPDAALVSDGIAEGSGDIGAPGEPAAQRANPSDSSHALLRLLRRVPEDHAKAFSVFPIAEREDGRIVLACAVMPDRERLDEIEQALGAAVEIRLAQPDEIAFALSHGYALLGRSGPKKEGGHDAAAE